MPADRAQPLGVVLAGGRSRRLGGAKASAELCGRPLISYPIAALAAVLDEVAVVAKGDTGLPPLHGCTVWIEREIGHHPLFGLAEALARGGGRAVVVCALDLPLVSPELVRRLITEEPRAVALIAASGGDQQPLLGRYQPSVAERLRAAAERREPVRAAVAALGARMLEVRDPDALLNVNTPADMRRAQAVLSRRSQTWSGRAG